LNTVNIAQGIEAGLAIVIVAIVLDRLLKKPGGEGAGAGEGSGG
jgi:glycine betaine/proline transport system permease protein